MRKTPLALTGAIVMAVAACTPAQTASASPSAGTALHELSTLRVAGNGPMTGYSRVADFGPAWTDNQNDLWGHNGCDTRDDILRRDMKVKLLGKVSGCEHVGLGIKSGVLADPYTGKNITMVRGKNSSAIQIDHIVPLGNAWITGARSWSQTQRVAYANDPLVLVAADGPANEQKGDSNAASWLPKNTAYRACYVARQIAVKEKYHLSVTPAEKVAMAAILAKAPNTHLPTATSNHC